MKKIKKIDINEINKVLDNSNLKDNNKIKLSGKKVNRLVSNLPFEYYQIIKDKIPFDFSNYVKMLIEEDLKKKGYI